MHFTFFSNLNDECLQKVVAKGRTNMTKTRSIPREKGLEKGPSVLREGYLYILNRRKSFQSDVFETRLLGQKAICMGGEEATKLFYDPEKFICEGAMPKRVQKTLTGEKGVQSLDGDKHANRKAMFMSLMSSEELDRLSAILEKKWENALVKWEKSKEIVLYEEVQNILSRTACEWAGVPLPENQVKKRTNQLVKLFETPATIGPAHWQGRHARNEADEWVEELIEKVRNGELEPPENTALFVFSWHKDLNGELLPLETAAVDVLNILRPITAISIYCCFTGLAVHQYPEEAEKLRSGDKNKLQQFVQEVRRFYPFFPFQAAKVKEDFIWNGYEFKKGTLTLLDIYGSCHDPKVWDNPELFHPERFSDWRDTPFSFIPQGGGTYMGGHRCAGEYITLRMIHTCLDYLVNKMVYEVPEQDFSYSMVNMPSIPKSKMILANVKRK